MHKLIEYICDELEELERKAEKDGKLSMTEIQYADVLAHLKKDILTSDAMWEESEYSMDDGMSYRGSYAQGGGRNRSNRGGSYARGRGRNARRDSMGRYSREGYSRAEDDMDDMIMELREMMQDLPQEKQREVQKFIQKIEQM